MRVLVLEPFYGGSHRRFLDGWRRGSRHHLTLLSFAPYHWKWRMRHAALDFADEVERRVGEGESWDAVFCSSMLSLAEWRGLAPASAARLPAVLYFHENQLTYPVRDDPVHGKKARDLHFAFTHLTSAKAADAIWWNSTFHRDDFLQAAEAWIRRLPLPRPKRLPGEIRARSAVIPQGIDPVPPREGPRAPGPMRILWAARWEHDKNPEGFFGAIEALASRGVPFRLSVVGERFREVPPIFEQARERFGAHIDDWGFQESREDYLRVLGRADVFVSTARHEFFGVAAAEAMASGAYPLLPDRLAYPDLLNGLPPETRARHLYGSEAGLVDRLEALGRGIEQGDDEELESREIRRAVERFFWPRVTELLDEGLEKLGPRA